MRVTDGTSAYGFALGVNEETTAKHWTFVKRAVNSERGFRNDVCVVNVGGDTDDPVRRNKRDFSRSVPGKNCSTGSVQ